MRMILPTGLIGSMLLSCILFTPVVAQEAPKEKPRVYKHDFEGKDLTDRDFSKQNLYDANFAEFKGDLLLDIGFSFCGFC